MIRYCLEVEEREWGEGRMSFVNSIQILEECKNDHQCIPITENGLSLSKETVVTVISNTILNKMEIE